FFQAEDGIRDFHVTGVQTCALPIYPVYARIEQDTQYFDEKPKHPCWFNIFIPQFDSRIHCSYYPVNSEKDFEELRSDAFELANKIGRASCRERVGSWGVAGR